MKGERGEKDVYIRLLNALIGWHWCRDTIAPFFFFFFSFPASFLASVFSNRVSFAVRLCIIGRIRSVNYLTLPPLSYIKHLKCV